LHESLTRSCRHRFLPNPFSADMECKDIIAGTPVY
jgi:hypothetical protein